MATSAEKLAFIESIPGSLNSSTDRQQELRELLLSDTVNGKLYKYYSFKKRNIQCLKDGTMFCATPDSFNDPFDSKLGYTFQSIIDAKLSTELDRCVAIFSDYISVFDGKRSLLDCPEYERDTIARLLSNKRLTTFAQLGRKREYTEEEQAKLIKENIDIIIILLETIMDNKALSPYMEYTMSMMPKIIEMLCSGEMNYPNNEHNTIDDFAKATGIRGDADEIDKIDHLITIFSPENAVKVTSIKNIVRFAERDYLNKIKHAFRIGCLATSYKNNLMWSHYANSHSGFCLEFDFSGTDSYTMEQLPLPIVYSNKRPLISWKPMIDNTPENVLDGNRQIIKGLLTKDSAWEYENEWRILIKGDANPFLKMPPVSCIYLGACMCNHNIGKMIKIAGEKGIPVKHMEIDRGAFELHAKELI